MLPTSPYKALKEQIDAVLEQCFQEELIAGAVVMVNHDGKTVCFRAYGFADPENDVAMQIDSLFRLSSVTKVHTSLATAALIEQGKIALDDPVTKWLPEFTPKTLDGNTPTITIRHLLTHTAGLDYKWAQVEDGPYELANVSDGLDISGITLEENLKRIASVPLRFAPGTHWLYSLSPDVLGAVIAKAHGTSLEKAMEDLITGPLGMKDSRFVASREDRARMTVPYFHFYGELIPMAADQYVENELGWQFLFSPDRAFDPDAYPSGGVGMIGTAQDVMQLVEAIRTNRMPTVSEELMNTMSTNILPEGLPEDPSLGYCMGWGIVLDPERAQLPQSPGTLQGGGVYGHTWFADRTRKLSVVIMTTTAVTVRAEHAAAHIRNTIYKNLPE